MTKRIDRLIAAQEVLMQREDRIASGAEPSWDIDMRELSELADILIPGYVFTTTDDVSNAPSNLNIGDRQHQLSTDDVRKLLAANPVIIPPSFGYPEMSLGDVRKAMTDADNCSNCGMANWYGIFEYILERAQEQIENE